jgi:glycosyltransferase involved in cell wall biosynthesis
MKKPKVSIIIPVYNGEKYLREAIDSVLSQTYKNIEIIVVNDGSNDKTEEIALSYGDKIRYFSKENGGVSTALNLALTKMTGEYFSWLSHDDVYLPEKIEEQIDYLIKNKELYSNVILYSDYILINENSDILYSHVMDTKMLNKKPEYGLLRAAINGITLLIPKIAFEKCGNFDEKLRCTQDYDLWLKMMNKYKFVHMPAILAKSRVHKNQQSNINPRVLTEGNPLWIKMIESVPDKRKISLEGSIYNYYYEMACYVGKIYYVEALRHCVEKLNELDKTQNFTVKDFIMDKREKLSFFKLIKKVFISFKQLGLKNTIVKIKRFFMNRRLYK